MKVFKLNDEYSVACEFHGTRNGFKHTAVLLHKNRAGNSVEVDRCKVNYYNRTWERYEFRTVLIKMIDKYFKKDDILREFFLGGV